MASFILFRCQTHNINILCLHEQKSASLGFDEKNGFVCFLDIENKNKNLPDCLICFSKKWPEMLAFVSLILKSYFEKKVDFEQKSADSKIGSRQTEL